MKRIVLALVVAILLFTTLTALGEDKPATIRLGGTGNDYFTNVVPLENGNLLLTMSSQGGRNGQSEYPQHARKMWLLCLAPDGSTVWETEYGEEKGSCGFYELTLAGGSVTGTLKHSINDSWQYKQRRAYSLADGTLLSEGEKVDPSKQDRNISLYTYPLGAVVLEEEIHDCQATCEPRLYRLRNADGDELWCVDAKKINITNQDGRLRFEESTLLCGREWNEESLSYQPVILRIDDGGNVVWRTGLTDIEDGFFRDALVDSRGRMVLTGISRSALRVGNEGYGLGYEDPKQLLLCVDAATGEQIWRHENPMLPDEVLPIDDIIEVEVGYLIAGTGLNHIGNALELLDFDGNALARWSTMLPETVAFGHTLFHWSDETWVGTIIDQDGTQDVYLERVEIPKTLGEPIDTPKEADGSSDALGQTVRELTAKWEAELGPHPFWTLEKKVAFYQACGSLPSHTTAITSAIALPGESDVTQEAAIADAKLYIQDVYKPEQSELDALAISVGFYPDGDYSAMSGAQRTWVISFCDAAPDENGEYAAQFFAYVPSPRGEPTVVRNLSVPLLMGWGLSQQAASDLTERSGVYYNPNGGKYFHREENCAGIPEKYRKNVESFDLGLLSTETYHDLKPCPICLP